MGTFKEIDGDLISLALAGHFDLICHGVNCFSIQNAGIAYDMKHTFKTNTFPMESLDLKGDYNKMGCIDSGISENETVIINCYTQFQPGPNADYTALRMCMKKINHTFKGVIGLPLIGCGIGGLDWNLVKEIIKEELTNLDVVIVHYKPEVDE